ncbi:MAG: S1C family serine protease [Anaerolineae bacterium]|jgi:S1-C subfamily serine protease|nr:S1C family serine protease [Anaerolineae bacterium]
MSEMLKSLSDAMADAVAALSPSIVRVEARKRLPTTGIVWSAEIIVTAHHGVERDDNIKIVLHDGSRHEATLIGRDAQNDLAVLRVPGANLPPAKIGDNAGLRVGNLVLAVGRPGDQVQATLGVVSALIPGAEQKPAEAKGKGRRREGMQVLLDGYVQTDVVMYPGFSGGPLVSGDGAVHGLNTSGFGSGVSVTVPVATIRNTVGTLLAHGKMRQGYLGVGVQPVRLPEAVAHTLKQETGLLVMSVESGSPAHQAGLLVGDIVVALAGSPVEHLDELLALLHSRAGQAVTAGIVRGGEHREMPVTIGERQ